jgi:hypothetical protein
MNTIYKVLFGLSFVSLSLFAGWGDADKLADGSCKFEKESGYSNSRLYTKGNEAFVIVDTTDTRYGTTSVVFNAHTCEKITSGSKYDSNFGSLMRKKGFTLASRGSGENIDSAFQNEIVSSENRDATTIKVGKIDHSITKELEYILRPLTQHKVTSPKFTQNKTKKLVKTNAFKNAFLHKINTISKNKFNYRYALNLNKNIGNYSDVRMAILKKYLHHKVKKTSQLSSWAKNMHHLGQGKYISQLKYEIMNLPDFGKHLTLNNFLSSNEYRYALQYSTPSIHEIQDDATYGIKLVYGSKNFKLTKYAKCKSTGSSTYTTSCGFLWVNTCDDTYANYRCSANTARIAKIERKVVGKSKVASELKKGWKYSYRTNRYVHPVKQYVNNNPSLETSDRAIESKKGNYLCSFVCYNFGGVTGWGKEVSKNEHSVGVSANTTNQAKSIGVKMGKKICSKLGFDGIYSRWGSGSAKCVKQ